MTSLSFILFHFYNEICFNATQVSDANAGFPKELNICKKVERSWEEELRWTVDNHIRVGPGETIMAKLIVKENQWEGDFSVTSQVSGKVNIVVRRKDTGEFITAIKGDLVEIFLTAFKSGLRLPGLEISTGQVYFITKGHVNFRYGVEQFVNVTQTGY